MRAMILAAGRGERLRPLTDTIPKPLIEVGGKPLIVHHLERLAAAGFADVVINLGWLGEKMRESLGDGSRFGLKIHYSPEPPGALETAGGIVHALPLLGKSPFAVISGDIFCDYPFERLAELPLGSRGHLVMVDNPAHHPEGDFGLEKHRLSLTARSRLTYSGIAIFSPELFRLLEPGVRPLRPILESGIQKKLISGEYFRGYWSDVGTPERLREVNHR
jgi:N-acetyl-alpha-D-muramate 1-phosphate uridylyltransferase